MARDPLHCIYAGARNSNTLTEDAMGWYAFHCVPDNSPAPALIGRTSERALARILLSRASADSPAGKLFCPASLASGNADILRTRKHV